MLKLILGGVKVIFFFKNLFSQVILRLYTKFQCPTMPGTGLKVCVQWVGGGVVGGGMVGGAVVGGGVNL